MKISKKNKNKNDKNVKVLFVIAYLRQCTGLNSSDQSLYLPGTLHEYWFDHSGFLSIDIITMDQVCGPLNCLYDVHRRPPNNNEGEWNNTALRTAKQYRFIVQYPFQRDLTTSVPRISNHNRSTISTLIQKF